MNNQVMYNENLYINEYCTINGAIFKLENAHQKKVWLTKVSERDKVFLREKENTLIGVCKDTERVIAYIHTDLGDLAFCSDAVMQSERFKSSLLDEDFSPYDDWQLCVNTDAELVANNQFDLYDDKSLYIDAKTAAYLINVELEDIFPAYKKLLIKASEYLPEQVQNGLEEWCMPNRQNHFYMYEAFGLSMDSDEEVLHSADWYEPQVVASRLIKAYTDMLYARLEDESYTCICKERVARARKERRKQQVEGSKSE